MKKPPALIVTDDFTIEPRPRHVPIPFDCRGRYLEESGCVLNGQSAEIAQFDDSALLRVAGVQTFKRVIERDHIHFARVRDVERLGKLDLPPAAAAFGGLPLSGMVDQDGAD